MTDSSFWTGTRVLVGGGCGFLGSYLVDDLVKAGAQVTVADNLSNGDLERLGEAGKHVRFVEADLRDPAACDRVVERQDVVFNLAAKAFGMEYSRSHNGEMLVYNLLCSLLLLEAARRSGASRYVVFSSSCVYPDDAPVPTPELETFTGLPESVNEGYGWAKRMQELAARYYTHDYDMKITVVRPFNPYGANYRWGTEEKAHVMPALVKRILDGEDPVVIWGSGRQRRNFLHASDAARLIVRVTEADTRAEPVNIGYEEDTSIADLVTLVCEVSGRSPRVLFDTSKPEGRFRKCADSTRLRRLSGGYVPQVSLRDGVAEMLDWYRRSFGDARA